MKPRAFTLIELLIVVAIIAILAAVAVPNFLEAQTRARVSRCMSDMRTLAQAVEVYQADCGEYPAYGRISSTGAVQFPATVNSMYDRMCFISPAITTPLAYIATFPMDPFMNAPDDAELMRNIEYINLNQHVANMGSQPPAFAAQLIPAWGRWRMVGAGPDHDRGLDIKNNIVYDPTNGTISDGDVVRCQRYGENKMNPIAP
ncbi:MAG: prepilin-type N-terminal cleavage/methylation domain-containing protein [Candidatus Sumerlaeia bacterium]